MKNENIPQALEASPMQTITPPMVESLLHPEQANNLFPEEIRNDPELQSQAEKRRELFNKLESFYTQVPHTETNIEAALESKLITEKETAELYDSLSNLLEDDSGSNRILLYLPFELLPNQKKNHETPGLTQASERFSSLFKHGWQELLAEHNLRADFIDGDVPEFEHRTGPLPQVVKAAHLIPKLVERGIVSTEEILSLMEQTPDDVLAESIADTLPVLADMELLSEDVLRSMEQSKNQLLSNMSVIIRTQNKHRETAPQEPEGFSQIILSLNEDQKRIQAQYKKDPSNRSKWLEHDAYTKSSKKYGHKIHLALKENIIHPEELATYFSSHKNERVIPAIIFAVQEILEDTPGDTKEYSIYKPLLIDLWEQSDDLETRDIVESTFCRLFALGITTREELNHLKISPPMLKASFSERISPEDTMDLRLITTSVESNAELSKLIYPATLLMGSRMNGYGKDTSDLDLAVFVRPDVSFEERARLQKLVREAFIHEKIQSQPMEFWLEENGNELSVQDFKNPDTALGDSTLAHPLLGAWCGNESTVRELHERLLSGYLYSEGKKILDEDARCVWLEEMEHNILQYRLMHKGYERFFPAQGGIHTPHSDAIDDQSAFYDSGYRRLATQLFVNKVFLPQLKKPDNH